MGRSWCEGPAIAAQVWRQGRLQPRAEDWLATGDLATRNAAGELVFAGRKSDVIVTSAGLNIHPQDLEEVLHRQSGLRDSLIVAYDSAAGPTPAAVLIADPGQSDDLLKRAVDVANGELAPFQQIRYWLRWPQPEFPRTSTGKVLRRVVQSWAQQSLASDGAAVEDPFRPAAGGAAPSRSGQPGNRGERPLDRGPAPGQPRYGATAVDARDSLWNRAR